MSGLGRIVSAGLLLAGLAAGLGAGPGAAQTTGKNPSHADILRGFDAAVFWASREDVDYGGTYNPVGFVMRWQTDILYRVDGLRFKPDIIALAIAALRQQAAIAGVPVREAKDEEDANFILVFRDVANFSLQGRKASCYMNINYDRLSGRISKATLQMNLSAAGLERCVRHETLHGFGLLNHPHKLHSLLSYYTSSFVYDMTEADIVMLQTLYDPRMKAGMSRLPGLVLADQILEEKRRALNPAAPPKTDSTAIFQATVADLEKAAAAGNMRATLYLTEAHQNGIVVPQDAGKARAIIDQAAQQTETAKRFDLAYALAEGLQVARDEALAAMLYRSNAEAGHRASQNNLAVLLRDGRGVPRNKMEALMWFTIAASTDYALAERNRQSLLPQLEPILQDEAKQRAAAWKPVGGTAK